MLPLRYGKFWLTTGWLVIALTLAAFVAPGTPMPDVFGIDKLQHLVCFLFLTVWFCGLYPRRYYRFIAAGLLLYACGTEVLQGFLTYRTASLGDLLADATGVAAGLLAANAGAGRWCIELERRWLS